MIEYGVLQENEIPLLLELYKQLIPNNDDSINKITEKSVWKEIGKNNIKYYVAKDNGKIIGACFICIIPNLSYGGKSIGFIENVITDENYKRKGIGKTIIKMAIEYAKEQNCYKVLLQSGIKRTESHKFYEAVGFEGESKKAYEIRFI